MLWLESLTPAAGTGEPEKASVAARPEASELREPGHSRRPPNELRKVHATEVSWRRGRYSHLPFSYRKIAEQVKAHENAFRRHVDVSVFRAALPMK